jgi:DNA-binding response OmpR family regulator
MPRYILVVDDEPALRQLVARGFRERGYDVAESADGMAALELASTTDRPFDLVVTNSRMPHLDGPHLAQRLRQLDAKLPIIHLSGSHGKSDPDAMPADVPTFFKPFNLWDLLAEADELMNQREAEGSE